MERAANRFLILDANVLIDLIQCDKLILPIISMYVGQVMVASTILEEIKGFETCDCLELGIQMIEPTFDQVVAAAERPRPLSLYDWLCLLVEAGGLPPEECKTFIREIQRRNPYFITDLVVESAFRRLDGN